MPGVSHDLATFRTGLSLAPAGISITRAQELTLLMLDAAEEAFANQDAPKY